MIGQRLGATLGRFLLGLGRVLLVDLALLLGAALLAVGVVDGHLLAPQVGQHGLPTPTGAIEAIGDGKTLAANRLFLGLPGLGGGALLAHTRALGV